MSQGGELQVNSFTAGPQYSPAMSVDASGGFVVAWQSAQDGDSFGVFAQRFDAAGARQGTEFQVNAYTSFSQAAVAATGVDGGEFVIAWLAQFFTVERTADIDGNGAVEALTDGLLCLRHLFGFRGATLITGALAPNCTRCTAPKIEAYLAAKV